MDSQMVFLPKSVNLYLRLSKSSPQRLMSFENAFPLLFFSFALALDHFHRTRPNTSQPFGLYIDFSESICQ